MPITSPRPVSSKPPHFSSGCGSSPAATPQYYPLTHTLFWIEAHLWGAHPTGYHTVNILLQIANALLLWRVLYLLDIRASWLIAAVFAIHPINVESVAWITEQKNTASGFFYLLAFLLALRSFDLEIHRPTRDSEASSSQAVEPPAKIDRLVYGLCVLCFIAAVLCKTVTSTLPAAVAVVIWWKRGRLTRRDIAMLMPFFAVAVLVAFLTGGMEQWNVGAYGLEFQLSAAQRVLIAGRAVWFYAARIVWPANLTFIYPRWHVSPGEWWQWLFPAGALVIVTALFLFRRQLGRGPLCAVLFFVGTLFPGLGFINVYPMRFSFVADHFQYLAGIGIVILAVSILRRALRSVTLRISASAVVLTILAVLTFRQSLAYKDESTLWRDTLVKNPTCWLAMDNLGVDAASKGDMSQALSWYDRSLALYPAQPEAHMLRGEALMAQRRFDDAAREFDSAVAVNPGDVRTAVRADHARAKLAVARGRLDEAARLYAQVLIAEPRLEAARLEYAMVLRRLNHPEQAIDQYQKAIEQNPDSVAARTALAEMLFGAGYLNDAMVMMAQAIEIEPDPRLRNNYGVMLMKAGRPSDAAGQFTAAINDQPDFADAYDGLGAALEAQGRRDDAVRMFQKALSLNPALPSAQNHLAHVRQQVH